MARTRLIRPGFFRDADLYDAEVKHALPLRVAFAGLWTVADREGRFHWKPRELKPDVLPYDNVDFTAVLEALESEGFIQRYVVDGRIYGLVPTFGEHQTFHQSEGKSHLPAPEGVADTAPDDAGVGRPSIPRATRRAVFERDKVCQKCGSDKRLEVDHIVPWSKGGTHDLANLRLLCKPCNGMRGSRIEPPDTPPTPARTPTATPRNTDAVAVTDTGTDSDNNTSSAREQLLTAVPNRAAWEGEIQMCRGGARGQRYRASEQQIETACRDYLGNGASNSPNMAQFRAYIRRAVTGEIDPPVRRGGVGQRTFDNTMAALKDFPETA